MSGRGSRKGLSVVDLVETAWAFALALVVEVGLHTARLPWLSRMLGVPLREDSDRVLPTSEPVIIPHWARRRLRAARRALKYWPFGDSCLRVALVGGCLVRRLDPVLRIGVTKHEGQVKAHAWIEIGGLSLDPASVDFRVVDGVSS